MNALHALELEHLPDAQEKERFRVTDINAANWALRKIAAARAAIRERETLASAETERIRTWLEDETESLQQTIRFFESLLYEYHTGQIEADPKCKTIKLPHGILKMRAQQPQYHRDPDVIREWAEANKPDVLIPQLPKLDWAGLKKALKVADGRAIDPDTGEVIPGITVTDRPPKFSVEVD